MTIEDHEYPFSRTVRFCSPVCRVSQTAHHSTATYDRANPLEMEAELVSVSWRNPHTRFTVSRGNIGRQLRALGARRYGLLSARARRRDTGTCLRRVRR